MSSPFTPRGDDGHPAFPAKDTWVRQDGEPASLLFDADYPVTAVCQVCGQPIRLEYKLQMEWRHVPAEPGSPS